MLVLFLTTTSGITIYSHYCSTSLVQKQSLIESLANCGIHDEPIDHSKNNASPCCKTDYSCKKPTTPGDCCSDLNQYFKITDLYVPSSEIDTDQNISTLEIIMKYVADISDSRLYTEKEILNYSLPPPRTGKQKVLLFHQLKTAPDLA